MRKPIATAALLLAWLCANGALLDGLQVFAWTRMFATYTETMSVGAALRETFDPAKPCELCVGVATAKEDLNQKSVPATIERSGDRELILALHFPAKVIIVRPGESWPASGPSAGSMRQDDVPVPPPRV